MPAILACTTALTQAASAEFQMHACVSPRRKGMSVLLSESESLAPSCPASSVNKETEGIHCVICLNLSRKCSHPPQQLHRACLQALL